MSPVTLCVQDVLAAFYTGVGVLQDEDIVDGDLLNASVNKEPRGTLLLEVFEGTIYAINGSEMCVNITLGR